MVRWSRSLDQRDAVGPEDCGELRACPQFAPRSGGELRNGTVVNGQVFVAVESGLIPDAVQAICALIDRQAGPLTKAVRTRAYGIGRHAEGDGVAAPQIEKVETRLYCDVDMDVVVQIAGAQHQRARIAIPQVTDDGLEEGNLEGLPDIIDPETAGRLPPWIREPAR